MYLVTWFGTIVCIGTKQLRHVPLISITAGDKLVEITPKLKEGATAISFQQAETSEIDQVTDDGALGATLYKIAGSMVVNMQRDELYFCAEPTGSVSFNRTAAGIWEQFLLITENDLATLKYILEHSWAFVSTGRNVSRVGLRFAEGFQLIIPPKKLDISRELPTRQDAVAGAGVRIRIKTVDGEPHVIQETDEDPVDIYLNEGYKDIFGVTEASSLKRIAELHHVQRSVGIKGGLVEIGVFHGRILSFFGLLAQEGEDCLAIDVFDELEKNYDVTGGSTTMTIVQSNFDRVTSNRPGYKPRLFCISGDSFYLTPSRIMKELDNVGVRLFSIDGAHSYFHTLHDLELASQVVLPGGVVLVDDITNGGWPGVMEGVARYFLLGNSSKLCPFMLGDNKLWLTTYDFHPLYLEYARRDVEIESHQMKHVTMFFGWPIVGF